MEIKLKDTCSSMHAFIIYILLRLINSLQLTNSHLYAHMQDAANQTIIDEIDEQKLNELDKSYTYKFGRHTTHRLYVYICIVRAN